MDIVVTGHVPILQLSIYRRDAGIPVFPDTRLETMEKPKSYLTL